MVNSEWGLVVGWGLGVKYEGMEMTFLTIISYMEKKQLFTWFQRIGMLEGISFLVLLGIAMPLKYFAGMPKAVSVVGMAHGVLFIAYLYMIHECRKAFGWSLKTAAFGAIASVLPFGPFVYDKWVTGKTTL
jgi:integral membrane protein